MGRWLVFALFFLAPAVGHGQKELPDSIPPLSYPPIARAAKVEGDVIVSFRQTEDGGTTDVRAVSGSPLLHKVAVENVNSWHFAARTSLVGQARNVVFHFRLNPPDDGFDDPQLKTKVELDADGGVRVMSSFPVGLQRSECPSTEDRVPPSGVVDGDFVELTRWDEVVRVDAYGSILWKQWKRVQRANITRDAARALLEGLRTAPVWGMCGEYEETGLMDGGVSSFKLRLAGREKSVSEYGNAAPPTFQQVELAIDAAANTHRWRHGDPATESIINIGYEHLPKPNKTMLMDAASKGDKAAIESALRSGNKLSDADASGWTPLMYAAGSSYGSAVQYFIDTGVNVNARSMRGETALMASAAAGMADEDLLEAGADVNAVNDVGTTALMLLVQRGHPEEIATLLKAGADARKRDRKGRTALDYLNAANCGRAILQKKDPDWMEFGLSKCSFLDEEDYKKSKLLLIHAGAGATRSYSPKSLSIPSNH